MPHFRKPSPAMCVALLGLFVALGGTTWAATALPARSVGTAQLKADAVTGGKVKNHSLTGADVESSSLGMVPRSVRSATADLATNALSSEEARHAATADSAGLAYSTHSEAAKQLTVQPATIASLQLPAGNYALGAKEQVDTFSNADIIDCDLVAGTDKDSSFVQGGAGHQSQIVTNSLVHTFTTPGTATLTCNTFGIGSISQVRVTAVTVGSIVSQPGP